MAKERQPLLLEGRLEIALPDGSLYQIAAGPYKKGIAVIPLRLRPKGKPGRPRKAPGPHVPGKRGRKPRPSTVWLREKLEADKKAKNVRDGPFYVKWLIEKDTKIGLPFARAVVYRELKPYK